jgi:hypothetical protein
VASTHCNYVLINGKVLIRLTPQPPKGWGWARCACRSRFVCINEIYDPFENILPELHGSAPTSQARATIQLIKSEETQGLRPEQCDGPRRDEPPAIKTQKAMSLRGVSTAYREPSIPLR